VPPATATVRLCSAAAPLAAAAHVRRSASCLVFCCAHERQQETAVRPLCFAVSARAPCVMELARRPSVWAGLGTRPTHAGRPRLQALRPRLLGQPVGHFSLWKAATGASTRRVSVCFLRMAALRGHRERGPASMPPPPPPYTPVSALQTAWRMTSLNHAPPPPVHRLRALQTECRLQVPLPGSMSRAWSWASSGTYATQAGAGSGWQGSTTPRRPRRRCAGGRQPGHCRRLARDAAALSDRQEPTTVCAGGGPCSCL
jgi:hypothetical protein